MDWLTQLTDWYLEQARAIRDAEFAWFGDLGVWLFKQVCEAAAYIVSQIPAPDFLTQYSLGVLLDSTGSPWLPWIFSTFQLSACFGVIALGVGFNLLRKLLTLGQW